MRRLIAASVLALALCNAPQQLEAFQWLYQEAPARQKQTSHPTVIPQTKEARTSNQSDHGRCISAIKQAEIRHGIPENLLLAIGLQEAGLKRDGILTIWPWTINSEGVGTRFDSKSEALAFARAEQAAGKRSYDVGCLQINMRWHGAEFDGLEHAFDPDANADYAARFLRDLRSQTSNWMTAAGNYHSKTEKFHNRYLSGIERNLKVATARSESFASLIVATQETSTPKVVKKTVTIKSPIATETPLKGVTISKGDNSLRASLMRPGAHSRQRDRILEKEKYRAKTVRAENVTTSNQPETAENRLTGVWWTSQLSQSNSDSEKRTIYSTESIEPVLPNLRNMTPLP